MENVLQVTMAHIHFGKQFLLTIYRLFLYHCVKIVQIRSFFWSIFSGIRAEHGDLLRTYPYSVRIQEN